MRNISAWSIRNPVVPIVLFLGLMLAGILSFNKMDVQDMPDIEFPLVIVSISQPGAAPSEIENQITQRVESAIQTLEGVESVQSTASEGNSQTRIEFELGTNTSEAVNEVKAQIDQIRGELPDGILEPRIFKQQTSSRPIVYFSVAADDMTLEQLSWFVDDTIAKRLLSVDGLAEVRRTGGVDREVLVILEPEKMQALGVTAASINQTLRSLNINAAGGQAEIAGSRQSVRVLGNSQTAYELSQAQIAIGGGRTVKLADIARVTDGYGELTSLAKLNGRQVVMFAITRARGESDVTVYDGAVEVLRELEAENPGIRFNRLFTEVDYTKGQYESSMAAMVEGAVLAVIVVFLFLRDWRATMISALAIPLSAIPTFWFLDLMGFSLNTLSLLALGLVAGVLVDDAIVEIENIVRHMRMGKSAYQASIDAADEIGLAVVATTFSIVAVFLPVGLMPGISGQFFKNFGLTVVVAVLMSLAVARLITPMIAAYFLQAKGNAEHGEGPLMDRYMNLLRWSIDERGAHAFKQAAKARHGRVSWLTRLRARLRDHRLWMIGIGFAALAATGLVGASLPGQFFPTADTDFSLIQIEMVPGTTLEQTEAVVDAVAERLREEQEVALSLGIVNEGSGLVRLVLREDRVRNSMDFERAMTPVLQNIPDARVYFQDQTGPNNGVGSGRALTVMLSGADPVLLGNTANTLVEQMKDVPGVVAPRVDLDLQRPELIITPREDLAQSLGVSTSALSQAIRIATLGDIDQNAARFSLVDRQVRISVRLAEDARRDMSVIENLPVPTTSGGSVPLSRVAEISFGMGPTSIERYNQSRRVFIGADVAAGYAKGDVNEAINRLPLLQNLPAGVANTAVGQDEMEKELIGSFGVALPTGILLVFSVLVLLYHRLISPLVNMGSLFLAPLGGLLALVIVGVVTTGQPQPISMPVFIGILMLFGIVAKNSILLVDFALEEMAAGKTRREAILEAGHKRAQPIVMTTVAMVAGMVPTALSLAGDGAWRAPMGTVVIGGLILSTMLTLLIVPAGFSLADGLEKRLGPWLRRSLLTYQPGDDAIAEPRPAE